MSAARKLLPTIILVVLCVAGFLYAKSEDFFRKQEEQPDKLAAVSVGDVTGVSIRPKDGEELALEKRDGGWEMTKPSAIPVSASAVESWIGSYADLPFEKPVDENPQDLAKYGLGDGAYAVYEVKLADGSTRRITVGDILPTANARYVKLSDQPAVYRLDESKLQTLSKTQLDFMNKDVIDMEYSKLKSITYTWKGAMYEITKNDASKATYESDWTVNGKTVKGADIDSAFVKLMFLETDQLAKPSADVSLDSPEMTVEIVTEAEGKETRKTYVGKTDGDNVWLAEQGGKWAYAVPSSEADAVVEAIDKALNPPQPSPSPSPSAEPEATPSPSASPAG
ncbi:DUF4340 domain-containing protein [Paenibacillus thermoaerophilus]|uniref:DUF4340 domain-containing protein n=1 Tax=Paenibacillus thermoaerophilus TaxID=1215385 RepID=A0ABW2V2C6_9BACL|nr:DUF4340 domain-containing protein [Paenibacillus thermoaerophilus]TMV08248.1 DUF4340 domain-containing protein [Paenibacillus thermoaerophilus]